MITTKFLILIAVICCLYSSPVNGSSHDLVTAWKEITQNNGQDIQQTNTIYNKLREEQRAIAELRTIVERHLRVENANLLTNAIVSHDREDIQTRLREILQNMNETYDKNLIDNIFGEALKDVGVMKRLADLPDILWSIYKKGDEKLFEIMLRAQLQLYASYRGKFHADEKKYFYKFAYRLSKIKKDPLYNEMDGDLKANVESLQETLPNNVRYLFFAPYFCLQNVFHSKYIYAAINAKIDPLSRYIWLWHDNLSMDDTGYIKADVQEYNPTRDQRLKVALKSTKYQIFYYMMPNTKVIAGWDNNNTPMQHIWEIEFIDDDRVTFTQDNYLMCATTPYDKERRNVGGHAKGLVRKSSECQWRLGECRFVN